MHFEVILFSITEGVFLCVGDVLIVHSSRSVVCETVSMKRNADQQLQQQQQRTVCLDTQRER